MVFVSAFKSTNTLQQNYDAQFSLISRVSKRDMAYQHCCGVYKGTSEYSLGITCNSPWSVGMLYDWAKNVYDQECILLREPDGSCWLLSNSSSHGDYIGQWSEISANQASRLDAYTAFGRRYFAAM